MNPDTANLNNLWSLWRTYGAVEIVKHQGVTLWQQTHWPYRCWIESDLPLTDKTAITPALTRTLIKKLSDHLKKLPTGSVFAVFTDSNTEEHNPLHALLNDNGFTPAFSQTAMYLLLRDWKNQQTENTLSLHPISSPEELQHWVDIGSQAFGYQIDTKVIAQANTNEQTSILLAIRNNKPVATAMLHAGSNTSNHKEDNTLGIHQVAVCPKHQSLGIARQLMIQLIQHSKTQGYEYLALQASEAGKPLYESLGFQSQFLIQNYQKQAL